MNPRITEKEWLEDFKNFVETEEVIVPHEVSQRILTRIHDDLNPSSWVVFLKLLGIHSVVGTLSLAVCDQFGLNPFNTDFSLSQYFMKFGHSFCMVLCGFLFLGLTGVFSKSILQQEEFLVLKKNVIIQVFFLSLLSLVSFVAFGGEVIIGAFILWFLGALFGGFAAIQIFTLKFRSA
ncbi:MAG: hypothetical protein AAB966_04645 [Patescibacteria group bacterium]